MKSPDRPKPYFRFSSSPYSFPFTLNPTIQNPQQLGYVPVKQQHDPKQMISFSPQHPPILNTDRGGALVQDQQKQYMVKYWSDGGLREDGMAEAWFNAVTAGWGPESPLWDDFAEN
ncbi:unnamed protein product [Arabis nemorensis]|uniref:Uncharacterized protein n=1 Tax=Arabis nemorensis TaxID=586526 RepID=A0A565BGK5_9BRAS|nr:unnamed protein product [Arabis nemorensis]